MSVKNYKIYEFADENIILDQRVSKVDNVPGLSFYPAKKYNTTKQKISSIKKLQKIVPHIQSLVHSDFHNLLPEDVEGEYYTIGTKK